MSLNFVIENDVVLSYRRLNYTHWHALAEFIDNSTQAYFNNKNLLDRQFLEDGENLEIRIVYDRNSDELRVTDNSIGMSYEDLAAALKIGRPPKDISGRSQYGMGMKTAACWLGEEWEIVTKKLGEDVEHRALINVPRVASGDNSLEYNNIPKSPKLHYTYITIKKIHTKIHGRRISKIKEFLRSMYRVDLRTNQLRLWFQDAELTWEDETIFLEKPDGSQYKRDFEFEVGGKRVYGWSGILGEGRRGRPAAGFSILRRGRVVQGHPQAWRPEEIFGPGGSNDLINQRLVGEVHLDEFSVSHTKDGIQWEDDQEEEVEKLLKQKCLDFMALIRSSSKRKTDARGPSPVEVQAATDELREEMQSKEFVDSINIIDTPPPEAVAAVNAQLIEKASQFEPNLKLTIGDYDCRIFISDEYSVNDPYYVHEITTGDVVVVVNQNHPHWIELQGSEGVLNYLRHCVYDAISEWKASVQEGVIKPETVRQFKDRLLRLPAAIESAKDYQTDLDDASG